LASEQWTLCGCHVVASGVQVDVEGKRLSLSNLDKVLYPATGFAKGQVVNYYTQVAPALLPHLRGRPLTLKRYPNGVDDKFFYEKQCPKHRPEWVATAPIWSRHSKRTIEYCVVNDLPTLVWVANLASLELHTQLHCGDDIERPTMVAFDLDPGEPAGVLDCARVALWLRGVLSDLGLQASAKTSGSKGMQVYVPLNTPGVTYGDTKGFAHALAKLLEKQHPKEVVSVMRKDLRGGKVFIDWSQNDEHKTTVCVYSLRARPEPTASTPLTWDEIEAAHEAGDADALKFEAPAVLERVAAHGDLFAQVVEVEQRLPSLS
jgi:bifunctional non-homologous end joining protein LigD